MENLKQITLTVLLLTGSFLAWYLIISFLNYDLNMSNWGFWSRLGLLVFGVSSFIKSL